MRRFRLLAAFLSCLAVLAAGVAAAAAVVPGAAAIERTAEHPMASAPCSHCDDCDSVPCPMPVTACLQASAAAAPTLADASFSPPAIESTRIDWSFRDTILNGRSLPPDPFPPRA